MLIAMVVVATLWLFGIIGVIGLCAACKAAEIKALSLPRRHALRRGVRTSGFKRRGVCTSRVAHAWRPARRA